MTAHALEMDRWHRYRCTNPDHKTEPCHGIIFESVTTILNKAVPKDLSWHGQTRGIIGVKGLLRIPKYTIRNMRAAELLEACVAEGILGEDARVIEPAHRARLSAVPKYDIGRLSPDAITDALKREKLTVNDHRDQAAAGGTIVHKALEDYAEKGIIPSAAKVPESKRASIQGLAKFIIEYKPEFLGTEVRTLSVKHAYAGTFDLLCRLRLKVDAEGNPELTDRGALVAWPNLGKDFTVLVDLKTSRWIYPTSHFPQLAAYREAWIEMGNEAPDCEAVLWVDADGNMELVKSTATVDQFLTLKASAGVIRILDKSWKRPRKVKVNG